MLNKTKIFYKSKFSRKMLNKSVSNKKISNSAELITIVNATNQSSSLLPETAL
jgi:hypothetical protein